MLAGICEFLNNKFLFVDIPGTYSLYSNSEEEKIAKEYICSGDANATIVVVDATSLERNLNLVFQIMEITNNVIVCVNLLDEAQKKGIKINLDKLSNLLGVPVVGTIARKKKTLNNLMNKVYDICTKKIEITSSKFNFDDDGENKVSQIVKTSEYICKQVCTYENSKYNLRDRKIDKILTSKKLGIPIMLVFLGLIFWLTIIGSNYPSQILFDFFAFFQPKLVILLKFIHFPDWLVNMLVLGVYQTLTWVVSVMLPPMAIFFPLFTFLEDLGYLPRIAFNMDGFFKKCSCSGKQMITMCMGFGCNAAGCVGCRIINSPRERLIAILTNAFVPCNGRFPFLISISTIFIAGSISGFTGSIVSTIVVITIIIFAVLMTLIVSKILSKTILKGLPSSFVLELPPYRKPQFGKILIRSIFDRTLFVLGRSISVAAPAGLIIWLLANIGIDGNSLLTIIANFFDPFAKLMGLDGYILTAFVLGLPANEIVLPIILMCYLKNSSLTSIEDTYSIGQILINNGWNLLTAINVMIFTVLHFPCSTTLITIKKETGSFKWTALSFIIPTACGIVICMFTTLLYNIFV